MLAIRDLAFQYRRSAKPVFDGISLEVERGKILGLLGPNGAGKTTLISLICGLLQPSKGSVEWESVPLTRLRRERPDRFALVPQEYAFYPSLTVLENLRFFAQVQGLTGARLKERLDWCFSVAQLDEFSDKQANKLSGGLKRRLNFAIGLLSDPDLLLLDEPTVGIDPQSRHFLLDAIRTLGKEGKTILYASHYMDEIESICDRVAVLDQGRILLNGTLAEALVAGGQTLHIRLADPMPAALADTLQTQFALQPDGGNSYVLALTNISELGLVIDRLKQGGCNMLSVTYGEHNLEQVFLRLTGRPLRDIA